MNTALRNNDISQRLQGGKRRLGMPLPDTQAHQPWVSIITIVWNNVNLLEHTIKNVLSQTYTNIEYIIIDGASTDGTLDIIRKYDSQIGYWQSEPDAGLYDAMNKGLHTARGQYVWFINSGDMMYEPTTLSLAIAQNHTADILYGDTVFMNSHWQVLAGRHRYTPQQVPAQLSLKALHYGMCVCHQSLLVKRSIAPLYQLKYKINADYDWEIACVKNASTIHNTHQILSKFLTGGVATQQIKKGLQERWHVMLHHFGWRQTLSSHVVIAFRGVAYYSRYLLRSILLQVSKKIGLLSDDKN